MNDSSFDCFGDIGENPSVGRIRGTESDKVGILNLEVLKLRNDMRVQKDKIMR